MFSQPSLPSQPKPDTIRKNVKKAVRTILILVFVVVIVILLTLAVILSGRTGINPMQTPSPAPTPTPTAIQVPASSVVVVSVGLLQPCNPEVRPRSKVSKRGIGSANEITALPLNAL
jgi:hypothetical protein